MSWKHRVIDDAAMPEPPVTTAVQHTPFAQLSYRARRREHTGAVHAAGRPDRGREVRIVARRHGRSGPRVPVDLCALSTSGAGKHRECPDAVDGIDHG